MSRRSAPCTPASGKRYGAAIFSAAPATLTVDQTINTTYGGSFAGAVSLVKRGAGTLTLVDVRPADERALAAVPVAHLTLDAGVGPLEALAKDAPIAFLCHHGGRSAQAAEHFRQQGFSQVYNVVGGIEAWAALDPAVPRY